MCLLNCTSFAVDADARCPRGPVHILRWRVRHNKKSAVKTLTDVMHQNQLQLPSKIEFLTMSLWCASTAYYLSLTAHRSFVVVVSIQQVTYAPSTRSLLNRGWRFCIVHYSLFFSFRFSLLLPLLLPLSCVSLIYFIKNTLKLAHTSTYYSCFLIFLWRLYIALFFIY